MVLSALKVLELNKEHNLIENLCERELENPEGIEIEMRAGNVYKIIGSGFLGVEKRKSPEIEEIADINKDGNKIIVMKPGEYYLVKTMEKVNIPSTKIIIEEGTPARYLMPVIYPRSSLQRCGITLHCTITNPGYNGELTFGIKNTGDCDFSFELGSRMFKIVFSPVIGDIKRSYSGQHQGGRTTSQGEIEIQN